MTCTTLGGLLLALGITAIAVAWFLAAKLTYEAEMLLRLAKEMRDSEQSRSGSATPAHPQPPGPE